MLSGKAITIRAPQNEVEEAWESWDGVAPREAATFSIAPGGRGTELRVDLEHSANRPAGPAAVVDAAKRVTGHAYDQQVADDLKRFKQTVETGRCCARTAAPTARPTPGCGPSAPPIRPPRPPRADRSPAMRANVWSGRNTVQVENVPDPKILNDRDAIVQISSTAICGSDLHLYDGYMPTMRQGDVLGHEFMGTVTDVGKGWTA